MSRYKHGNITLTLRCSPMFAYRVLSRAYACGEMGREQYRERLQKLLTDNPDILSELKPTKE